MLDKLFLTGCVELFHDSGDEYNYRGDLWFAKRPGIGGLIEGMAPEYKTALKGWNGKSLIRVILV